MAFNLTTEDLERLQQLQRLHQAQQIQQAAALHQPPTNDSTAPNASRATQVRRRRRQPHGDAATERMITDARIHNRANRRAFKAWYRTYKQTLLGNMAQDCIEMTSDVARYGVSRPEWVVEVSSGDELRDFFHGMTGGQKLALFDLALARQEDKGDITSDKVAVFNTVIGRRGDMPLGTA